MNKQTGIAVVSLALTLGCGSAAAQNLGGLGNLMSGAKSSGSMGNVAGLLEYCVTNNYLGGSSGAAGIKDKLLDRIGGSSARGNDASGGGSSADKLIGRLTGHKKSSVGSSGSNGNPTNSPAYLAGVKGMLESRDGKTTDLAALGGGSSSLKSKLIGQVCDTVLKQGKSFLGM